MFHLENGQRRENPIVPVAGWHNQEGSRVGHGDVDITDFEKIVKQIPEGEQLFILTVDDDVVLNTECDINDSNFINFLYESASYAITSQGIFVKRNIINRNNLFRLKDLERMIKEKDASMVYHLLDLETFKEIFCIQEERNGQQ